MKNKKLNPRDQLLVSRQAAMPEVKKLVKNYGRAAIGWCLNQLRDYEVKVKNLADARRELAEARKAVAKLEK